MSCSGAPDNPAGSAGGAAPAPTGNGPAAGPATSIGPGAGPAVPTTTPPFGDATPGVVTTVGGMQQVVISGTEQTFNPGVFHVHRGRVRVILRNDDPTQVHNLIFQDNGGVRTKDIPPGQASDLVVLLEGPGLYDFICSYHLLVGMRGQAKVE